MLDPGRSLLLTAPLSRAAGGEQRCGAAVYSDRDAPQYRRVLDLIGTAVARAADRPRRDLKALHTR